MADKPHATVDSSVDPDAVQRAQRLWHGFTQASKWGTIITIAVLIALAIAFV